MSFSKGAAEHDRRHSDRTPLGEAPKPQALGPLLFHNAAVPSPPLALTFPKPPIHPPCLQPKFKRLCSMSNSEEFRACFSFYYCSISVVPHTVAVAPALTFCFLKLSTERGTSPQVFLLSQCLCLFPPCCSHSHLGASDISSSFPGLTVVLA